MSGKFGTIDLSSLWTLFTQADLFWFCALGGH